MSEKKGFKNCPSITEFRVGMRVRERTDKYTGEWFTVAIVLKNGCPVSDRDKQYPFYSWRRFCDFELDLESIWVGREYRNAAEKVAVVTCVNDTFVGFLFDSRVPRLWYRARFVQEWEAVSLNQPQAQREAETGDVEELEDEFFDEKCEGCEKPAVTHDNEGVPLCQECADQLKAEAKPEPWKPKVGKPCLWHGDRVEVNAIKDGKAWVTGVSNANGAAYDEIPLLFTLRPLPPEPPIQVGDFVVVVNRYGKEFIGKVSTVEPDDRHFLLSAGDGQRGLTWDDVTITKLVPAPQEAKS